MAVLASIVIPTWNGAHLLAPCLDSLRRQSYAPIEVVVADGASTDGTDALLQWDYPEARLVRLQRNRGFAGNVNAGLRAARGEVLLLLNNDAVAEPEWVATCVAALDAHPRAGSVASKMLFGDRRTINSAGDGLTVWGRPVQLGAGQQDGPEWSRGGAVFGASGGAAAYRRDMLRDVGLFDEVFFAYLEDVDLAFRAQLRGWTCVYEPRAVVVHRDRGSATGGGSLASYLNGRNLVRLLAKNVPAELVPRLLPGILRYQLGRAGDAAAAWRGAAARATLRGQVAGLAGLPWHLAARRDVQARRRVSAEQVHFLLLPDG